MVNADVARAYYDAIDTGEYDGLGDLLATGFVQVRPDRRLTGRDRFVRFMRNDRPFTDTEHLIEVVYRGADGVAIKGRLQRDDRDLFEFIDAFTIEDNRITELSTYTR